MGCFGKFQEWSAIGPGFFVCPSAEGFDGIVGGAVVEDENFKGSGFVLESAFE